MAKSKTDFTGIVITGLVMVIFAMLASKLFTQANVTKVEDALNRNLPIDLNSSADSVSNWIKRWFGTYPDTAASRTAPDGHPTVPYIGPYSPDFYATYGDDIAAIAAGGGAYVGPYSPELYDAVLGGDPGSGS